MWYKLQIHESSRSCCVEDLWLLIKFPPIRSCAFYLNCFSPLVVGKVTGISYHGLTSQVDRERGKERAEKKQQNFTRTWRFQHLLSPHRVVTFRANAMRLLQTVVVNYSSSWQSNMPYIKSSVGLGALSVYLLLGTLSEVKKVCIPNSFKEFLFHYVPFRGSFQCTWNFVCSLRLKPKNPNSGLLREN